MKLEGIELRDFQAHSEIQIQFSPTITTIKGPTDRGKSAILRALRWVCQNDLGGDEFIREGQKKTTVMLSISDEEGSECRVTRTKSTAGGINAYALDGVEYKSFSTSVPTDIAKRLRLNDINFQGQHDSPFWFALSAGEVSRRLNSVIDLSVIDTTLSQIAAAVAKARERKAISEERLASAKEDLEKLKPQRERVEEFKSLKNLSLRAAATKELLQDLINLIHKITENQTASLAQQAKEGQRALELAKVAVTDFRKHRDLSAIAKEIQVLTLEATPPPDFSQVITRFQTWKEADEKASSLARLVARANESAFAKDSRQAALVAAEKRFHQRTKGENCPLCQSPLQ